MPTQFFVSPYPQPISGEQISPEVRQHPNQRLALSVRNEAGAEVCRIGHLHTEGGMPYLQLEDTRASSINFARNNTTGAIIVNDTNGQPLNPNP